MCVRCGLKENTKRFSVPKLIVVDLKTVAFGVARCQPNNLFMIGSNKLITSVFTIEIKNHKLAVGCDTIELVSEKHCEQLRQRV